MNSMEINKAFAAILTAGIAFGVTGFIGSQLVRPERPHHSAIALGQAPAAPAAPAAAPAEEPLAVLLANANVDRGGQLTRQLCGACHTLNEGGRAGVGPNMYGIIGKRHAIAEGFTYSAALKAKGDQPWGYEDMNAWLKKPSEYAPGTRMAFAGISNPQQRADVIAYLRTISPAAPPLPAVEEKPAAAAAPPAATPVAATTGLPTIRTLLASADAANGERLAKQQCGICHSFNEGGRNGVGPNLWNVVGQAIGHVGTFNYSAALKAKPGPWSFEELDAWLHKPLQYAPGTRMAFAGVNDAKQRADIIAYLRTLSAEPKPLD